MTLNYIFETTVCWSFFYLLYALWLRKETFFHANRAYLIGTLFLGLLIPTIDFIPTQQPIVIQGVTVYLNEITVLAEGNPKPDAPFQISELPMLIYWLGVAICLLRFFMGMGGILRLFIGSEIIRKENHILVRTAREHAPFSFLNFFFMYKKMNLNEAEWQQITRHEEAHIRGVHTLDVLLVEVLAIVFWFNPLIYLYKHAVRNVHEYLADAAVIKTVPMVHYGRFLVRLALPGFRMANNFNHSQLKKRIIMMTKMQSSKFALAKYILFIPLTLLMLIIFSCKEDIQNIAIKDATNDLQVSLLYTPDLEFFGEFNNAPENRTETSENSNTLYAAENRTTASLEEFEQEMKIEYAKLTDSAEQEAFKQTFIEELGKRSNIENLMVAFTVPEDLEESTNSETKARTAKRAIFEEEMERRMKKLKEYEAELEPKTKAINAEKDPLKRKAMINAINNYMKEELGIDSKFEPHRLEENEIEKQVSWVKKTTINSIVDADVFDIVDEMPRFPDCENIAGTIEEKKKCAEQKMLQYIYTNITYPAAARDAGVQGMVVVSFIVETDGRITNAKILRSLGYETDEEVIRLVENMPNWTPGMHEGSLARVKFNLPVRFKLEG